MSAKRIDMYRLQELVRLHRDGHSGRQIARMVGMGRNTVAAYLSALEAGGVLEGDADDLPAEEVVKSCLDEHLPATLAPQQESTVEIHRPEIEQMLEKGAGPQAIYDLLRLEREGFAGSLSAVKRLCLRIKKEWGVQAKDVAIPVETTAGEAAQVDFGYAGKLYDPKAGLLRRAWVFVMTLSYSRHMFADIVFDQKTETWLKLHVRAFAEFGGVPEFLIPDNLKAAVIRAAFSASDEPSLNRSYRELARHYGCKIDPTPPRSPEKKGRVESSVKYVKNNYFKPRALTDVEEARRGLKQWIHQIAGQRIHGTTAKRPLEVFDLEEKRALLPLPEKRYELIIWKTAKVHRDSHIIVDRAMYSVPWKHIGSRVDVRGTAGSVSVYRDGERLCTHDRAYKGQRKTVDAHLPDHRTNIRHRSREHWETLAHAIGKDVGDYISVVFDSDDVLSKLRTVQRIVTHLQSFPRSRAQAACRRALFYGNYTYVSVKKILTEGWDLQPLPGTNKTPHLWSTPPRFARTPSEIVNSINPTSSHELN